MKSNLTGRLIRENKMRTKWGRNVYVSSQREIEVTKTFWTTPKKPWELMSPPGTIFGRQFWALRCHFLMRLWSPELTHLPTEAPLPFGWCFSSRNETTSYLGFFPWRLSSFKWYFLPVWKRYSEFLTLWKRSWCLPELCLSWLIEGGQTKLPMTQDISEKASGSQG